MEFKDLGQKCEGSYLKIFGIHKKQESVVKMLCWDPAALVMIQWHKP